MYWLYSMPFACNLAIRYHVFRWELCKGCVWESVKKLKCVCIGGFLRLDLASDSRLATRQNATRVKHAGSWRVMTVRALQDKKFDLSREGKYRSANQETLQMIPDKFRIISFCSCNNVTIMGLSNLFISQKVSQLNNVTRMSRNCGKRIHMFNLGQHLITKIPILSMPTFKQYLVSIHF